MDPNKDNLKDEETKYLLNNEDISISIKDKNILFIYKKIEKISTALYLITSIIEEKDPIKWDLRQNSVDMLSLNAHLKDIFISEREKVLSSLKLLIETIHSSLTIARVCQLISEMNYFILSKEIKFTISLLNDAVEKKSYILNKEFFTIELPNNVSYTEGESPIRKDSEYNLGHKDILSRGIAKDVLLVDEVNVKDIDEYSLSFIKKNNRKNNILEIVKMKKRVTIKDISGIIKDCSEKTIQRELISLVRGGVLKKEGERRWSTYSLI